MRSQSSSVIIIGVVFSLLIGSCIPGTPVPTPTTIPISSAALVGAAWNALNNNQYPQAIESAQKCIDLFESEALKQQGALTEAPPIGTVTDDAKKAILVNWALNDVGTAYYIRGQALQKQGKVDEAKDAYQKAEKLMYARTWDPQGWFWSPAEAANKELAKLP